MISNNIDILIEESIIDKSLTVLAGIFGSVKFLNFLKLAKTSGIILVDPNTKIKNDFQEQVRLTFK